VKFGLGERSRAHARRLALLTLSAAVFAATSCSAAPDPAPKSETASHRIEGRVIGVADGDTLTLLVDREQIRIRLAQIDAPEFNQPYGTRAKRALSALAFRKWARVEVVDIDRYGRSVGEVFIDGIDVNRAMVREGHAWAYTKYLYTPEIIELEDAARAANKGLWALPEGQREPPWIWRHAPRLPQPKSGPLACGTRTHCSEMANCEEVRFYLEQCGVHSLDGDGDGTPCESLCKQNR
jgi:endonuclease YncB( thermonuclease family)